MMRTSGQSDPEGGSSLCPTGGQPFPNLEAIASEANEQSMSLFLSKLPIELRNEIYLLLWCDAGLEQHIMADKDYDPEFASAEYIWKRPRHVPEIPTTRFSHMACISDHSALDDRQEEIAKLNLTPDELEDEETWGERMNNTWGNHWKCEEAQDECRKDERRRRGRRRHPRREVQMPVRPCQKSPFLPMMLVCRRIACFLRWIVRRYLECRESIYGSLTFVIHDPATLHSFLITRRSPIVDEIRRLNLAIRLPIEARVTWLKPEEANTMAMWQASCRALSEARSLTYVSLWLETLDLTNADLLNTVPAVNPFVFDSRLASILTVDIPADPSQPEVWKDIAAIKPPFKIHDVLRDTKAG
ncbi:hypothetical protein PG984_004729 [Apiospora sp. TS-2023a]